MGSLQQEYWSRLPFLPPTDHIILEVFTVTHLSSVALHGMTCKESACNAEDAGSIPGSGRSPGGGNGNPLQYACLKNPMDRGAGWAIVHRVAVSQTQLSD